MNYFDLYGLPISFHPPQDEVKKQYYALSREYHPDFHAAAPADKQQEVMELSTANTRAYDTLSSPAKTLHYVLELYELLPEGEQYKLPQEFLLEMMDINEELMDLAFEEDAVKKAALIDSVRTWEQRLDSELLNLIADFEKFEKDQQLVKLANIKDLYFRMKYLARIKEKL